MKQLLMLVCAAVLAGSGPVLRADETKPNPDYYPLKPGTKWDYQVNAGGKIVKVSLCQNAGAFHYELVYLNGNGQVMTQALDAKTPFPQ